jgi:hypothetical protein
MPEGSADGTYVYYVQTWYPPSASVARAGRRWRSVKVLDGVLTANFTVVEGGIYYIDRPSGQGGTLTDAPSGETRLQYFDFATRRSRTLARDLGNVFIGLTASPDGRTILFTRIDSSVHELMLVEKFR